jgi:hypothetical protein
MANLMLRLSENAHLPFDRLTVLSGVEGLRYPHPSSLRRNSLSVIASDRRGRGNLFVFEGL